MSILRKPTRQEIADMKKVEKIRHDAELKRRLELAREHGVMDAERKFGKFKQPDMLSRFGKAMAGMEKSSGKKKKKGLSFDAEKMFSDLEKL